MASLIYNSALEDEAKGDIAFDSDSFKGMLVGSGYNPDKDAHTRRSHITDEVTGTGYTAGGTAAVTSVVRDNANDRIEITLGAVSWPSSTITARGLVYYKARGGAASADELVAYIDFGNNVSSLVGTLTVTASIYRKQN